MVAPRSVRGNSCEPDSDGVFDDAEGSRTMLLLEAIGIAFVAAVVIALWLALRRSGRGS